MARVAGNRGHVLRWCFDTARAAELVAEEPTLRDLRKAMDLTQERMAALLGIGQDSVSRVEQRSDLLLSTLRGDVEAMGGSLQLVAEFPDRPPVRLAGLGGLGARAPAKAVTTVAAVLIVAGVQAMPWL